MATKKPPQQQVKRPEKVALLKLDISAYAMPVDDALKVIALMKGAVMLEYGRGLDGKYKVSEREFELAIEVVGKNMIG